MLFTETLRIPAASMGGKNPLPDIHNNAYIHATYQLTDKVTPEEAKWVGKGMIHSLIPYLIEDGYDRDRQIREIPIIVLENSHLRAEFMPSLGGRLRRLYDKDAQKELLYVNPVFQPGNLALRNAWFSGGVEFNVGIKGHNPLTCSPMFAQRRVDKDGREYLSMYEYERIRGVVYAVNAYLPEDSKVLYIHNVIENTKPEDTYMYWWSNIATPENPGTRVIVPADETFVTYYGEDHYIFDKDTYPNTMNTDASYPQNFKRSLDFFYKIPPAHDKWIAAVDKDGYGLLHFSESRLLGRKLFLWGQGVGGRHWGEFLSVKNSSYIEIQAGLMHTQMEHFIMSGNSRLEWTEGYAAADVANAHGSWEDAIDGVTEVLNGYTGGKSCDEALAGIFPNGQPTERLFAGSGWGRLENRVRKLCGLAAISDTYTDWEIGNDEETADFNALLDNGILPCPDKADSPKGYLIGNFWADTLAKAAEKSPNWAVYNQLGVTLYQLGKSDEAEDAWKKSVACEENVWAIRNLAALAANERHDYQTAAEYVHTAEKYLNNNRWLAVDFSTMLIAAKDYGEVVAMQSTLPPEIRNLGRVKLLLARAFMLDGNPDKARELVTPDLEMPDVKEGELSLSAIWRELNGNPLPYALDFRMHE